MSVCRLLTEVTPRFSKKRRPEKRQINYLGSQRGAAIAIFLLICALTMVVFVSKLGIVALVFG